MPTQINPHLERLLKPEHVPHVQQINRLCDEIRETSFKIHRFLRNGHLERVYENALAHRLSKSGLVVIQQHPLDVRDEHGTLLGHFCADLFVENKLVVEIKAVNNVV